MAFLPQAFCSQLISFCRSRCAPSPTRLCAGAMRSGQLFSVHIVRRFTLGAPQLHKCSITLCWSTKYPSKDNLPLPLLARKQDNRQSDGETIGKATVRQLILTHYALIFCTLYNSFAREAFLMRYAYACRKGMKQTLMRA